MKQSKSNFDGILIGHSSKNKTGVTVIRFTKPAVCSYFMPGSAPATRDTQLLQPSATVTQIHALCLSGGSAFGLGVADGVMQALTEHGIGLMTAAGPIPIVPTACIYDLDASEGQIPDRAQAYQACANASANNFSSGTIGAATSASVGKYAGTAMAGGFGCAMQESAAGAKVLVCAVVNALGDIIDTKGKIIAGAQDERGEFIGIDKAINEGTIDPSLLPEQSNTSLVAVITNVKLDKASLVRLAKMASAGMARAVQPAFTNLDGDIIFAVSSGEVSCDEISLGHLAAKATQQAFINAVLPSSNV